MCEKTGEERVIKERLRDAVSSYNNNRTSDGEDEDDNSTNDEDKECDEQALVFRWMFSMARLVGAGVHLRTREGGNVNRGDGGGKVEGAHL